MVRSAMGSYVLYQEKLGAWSLLSYIEAVNGLLISP